LLLKDEKIDCAAFGQFLYSGASDGHQEQTYQVSGSS